MKSYFVKVKIKNLYTSTCIIITLAFMWQKAVRKNNMHAYYIYLLL